ncbi:MAG TPA: MFS transporter [Sporichthyaceae bacterium]|nr:MFS transporter [Sporichthyaceae bacterium]
MSVTTAASPAVVPRTATVPLRQRALLPVLIYCGLCLAVISSLGVLLIPTIAHAQHVSLAAAQWMLTLNLLVGAISTPVLGRIADGPHPRRVLIGMLICVLGGSLLAATSSAFPQLLVGRALQGLAYGIIPITITLARRHLPADRVGPGIAALSVTAATGIGLGYPFTGIVAEHLDFRVAFWVAAAFSATALAVVPWAVPAASPRERRPIDIVGWLLRSAAFGSGAVVPGGPVAAPRPQHSTRHGDGFDVVGTALLAVGLSAGLVGLSESARWGWGSTQVLGLLAGGALVLLVWSWWELRAPAPLVRLDLLRHPDVAVANLAAFGLGVSMYIGFASVGQLAQTPHSTGYGLGLTVFMAGVVITPLSIGSQLASRVATTLTKRWGVRPLLVLGAVFVTVASGGLALRHEHLWDLLAAMTIFGFGIGCTWAAMPGLIIQSVPLAEVGSATSFNQVLRTIGGSVGSAITGAVLGMQVKDGFPVDAGYRNAFVISAALGLVLLVALLWDAARTRRRRA